MGVGAAVACRGVAPATAPVEAIGDGVNGTASDCAERHPSISQHNTMNITHRLLREMRRIANCV